MVSITLNGVTVWFIGSAFSPNSYQVQLIIGILNAFLAAVIEPQAFDITWAGPPSTVATSTLGNLKVEAYSPKGHAGFSADALASYRENQLAIAPLVTAAKARIAAEEAACTAFYAKHGAPATWDTKDPTRPAPPRNFNKWYIALPPDAAVCRAYNALWGKPQRGKLPPQPPHKYQEWLALPAKRR